MYKRQSKNTSIVAYHIQYFVFSYNKEVTLTEITTAMVSVCVLQGGVVGVRNGEAVSPSASDWVWGSVELLSGVWGETRPTPAENEFGALYLS